MTALERCLSAWKTKYLHADLIIHYVYDTMKKDYLNGEENPKETMSSSSESYLVMTLCRKRSHVRQCDFYNSAF